MTVIYVYTTCPNSDIVHKRLDEIADRIPCMANYYSQYGEICIECRVEDAAWVENMIADLV